MSLRRLNDLRWVVVSVRVLGSEGGSCVSLDSSRLGLGAISIY